MAFSLGESWRRAHILRNQLSTETVESSAAVVGANGSSVGGAVGGVVGGVGSVGATLGVPSAGGGAGNKTHARVSEL